MVMRDVNADILGVIEADNRIALRDFSAIVLEQVGASPYEHVMVIDGNDTRGIDVGILTRGGYEITSIRSHVDDVDDAGQVFSRDCPEFTITTPTGIDIVVLANHLKSKGYGDQRENNARRERQATRVAQLYERLTTDGQEHVVVIGDLNDSPDSQALNPLLGTDLKDVSEHPTFVSDGRSGTYDGGTKGTKIDYVLLSPSLFGQVTGGAIFRKGVWGGKYGTLWPHYDTMTEQVHQASDHAAIYADINI
jgi:endonuclease/exonuclease/phosphatase family metal-dependent hydrolase